MSTEYRVVDKDGYERHDFPYHRPPFGVAELDDTSNPEGAPHRVQSREVTEWTDVAQGSSDDHEGEK